MFENIGGENLTFGGAILAALTWVWKKMNSTDTKLAALELEIAKTYVTKLELKRLEDKIDHNMELTGIKLDKITDTLLILVKN